MKKRLLGTLIIMAMLSLSACMKEEKAKEEEPIKNIDALYDKYVAEGNSEKESTKEAEETKTGTETEKTSEEETINPKEMEQMAGIYYYAGNWNFDGNIEGTKVYRSEDKNKFVMIYAVKDTNKTMTGQAVKDSLEKNVVEVYGDYKEKSKYTNKNGMEFDWYKYDSTNKIDKNAILEVFVYSNGKDSIRVETGVNARLGSMSQEIYDFIDNIKIK